jgi:hypothetical protein
VAWLYPDLLETDKYPAPSLFADVVIETPPQSKMRESKHKARADGEFIALLGGNSFLSRQGIKEQGKKKGMGPNLHDIIKLPCPIRHWEYTQAQSDFASCSQLLTLCAALPDRES